MSRQFKRWVSILVLGSLAFSHVSLALAACSMDRGQLWGILAQSAQHECGDEATPPVGADTMPMAPIACFSHSTADLQALGTPVSIDRAPISGVLFLAVPASSSVLAFRWSVPPTKAVPRRILLHSFLI